MSSTPEAPLQFDCPACGAVLTVPAAIAGMQGPCPKCWQEIISPDPAIGMPARLPAPPPPVAAPAPISAPAPEPLPAPAPVVPALPPEPEPIPAPVAPAIPEPPPVRAPALSEPLLDEEISNPNKQDEPAPVRRRRSKAPLVLAIGIPAVALVALGYYYGKDFKPAIFKSSRPGLSSSNQQPPVAPAHVPQPAPAPTPDETGQGLRPPPAPVPAEANDAYQALDAFLRAPDWQARSAFVLSPDEVRPAMEKHAKENGDGPIVASTVQLNEEQSKPPIFVFKVCTKAMPDGFPVPVMLTDEGPKIDWESFIAFNDDHFQKLLMGPPDQSGILNLLVKPEVGAEPSPHWVRYRLSVPMPGREATAWVRKDSVAQARLKAVFDGAGGFPKEIVDQLIAETGIPLRLAVAKRRTKDDQEFIEVVDMAAVGWAPAKQP